MKTKRGIYCLLFLAVALCVLPAEGDVPVPVPYGPAEFPEWQKDVRRAEILSFGALPFITFIASIYYDIYRYVDNDGDEGYLPWPLKKSDIAVPLTEKEQKNVFYAAAGLSVGVAVFDFGFRAVRRAIRKSRAEKTNREIIDPIVIEPIYETITETINVTETATESNTLPGGE